MIEPTRIREKRNKINEKEMSNDRTEKIRVKGFYMRERVGEGERR